MKILLYNKKLSSYKQINETEKFSISFNLLQLFKFLQKKVVNGPIVKCDYNHYVPLTLNLANRKEAQFHSNIAREDTAISLKDTKISWIRIYWES